MNTGASLHYLDNPEKYCNLVTRLIEEANDQWQTVWKSAILELFESSEYSINSVNALLKVIEKAFKERTYHIRAQAFDCWQFFISQVEKKSACEKLLNVILIPLSASNHSVKVVLNAKLKAWFTLLNTSILCKSISKDKGVPSLLKILFGPHTLQTASSYSDLLEICGTIYRLIVQKWLKNDENNLILSYLEKAVPTLSGNKDSRNIGKEIWIDVIEFLSEKRWPIAQFNYLLKTLENLLSTNDEQDKMFMCELLPVLICEYNSYPPDHLIPQLNLLTRCLLYSAPNELNLPTVLEYLMKKFRKKEQILFDELNKTLTEFSEEYKDQLQKCWAAVVSCFCKWNKTEIDSDNYCWILLFPVEYLHEQWNSIIQECMQTCFENMYSCFKVDTFIRNVSRKLNVFLNNSENVPVSLLSAASCLCKVILQKSRPCDDVSAIKDTLITIYEKLPSQTTTEGVQNTLISKYLSCVLYFMKLYPDHDREFKPIICEFSECIDIDKDTKEYPVIQLISKYTNNKSKEEDKLNNVLNKMLAYDADASASNKSNRSFLTKLSPAENKLHAGNRFVTPSITSPKLQNGTTPTSQKSKTKEDEVEFVAIKLTPKNSPMTEHQKEMAKEKSYIPALYQDLSQSQLHSESQTSLPTEKASVVTVSSVYAIEENTILPCSDTNADSADEIPASLNFHDAIRKDKSSGTFASKKSLFNDAPTQTSSNTVTESATETVGSKTKTSAPKRKSMRIENKIVDTAKRPRQSTDETPQSTPELPFPPPQSLNRTALRMSKRRKSVPTGEEKSSVEENEQSVPNSTTETESQNLFVPETSKMPTSTATPSLMVVKNTAEDKSTRKKSLKSKNANGAPSRSPINTRKRKSLAADTANSSKKPVSLDIDESCSETDERSIKSEKPDKDQNCGDSNENSSFTSSVVTVISAAAIGNPNMSQLTDSVVIVEDNGAEDIITIDSQSPVVETKNEESKNDSRVAEEEKTFLENTQIEDLAEQDHVKNPDEHDQSNESAKSTSTQNSFNLALSESENLKTSDDDSDKRQETVTLDEEDDVNDTHTVEEEQPENVENKNSATQKMEDIVNARKPESEKEPNTNVADNVVSVTEDSNTGASPVSGNSRTLQILQMVYNGTPNLSRRQTRFRSNTRSPNVATSPAKGRIVVNGVGPRTTANSRNMKMLQVNGHVESPVKPSPNKMMNFSEKMEKFRYIPKECTSPSILKKPNLNATMSPRSPKSVNFAERLTDTREYQVDESNYTDSWSSVGTQGNDLLSDDEATSQETLYPCLHNCNDDIRNIAERLTLNKQQLDTLRRMGIETVGQLASASTIIGKSIPVGDNRVQRLRNALKAYDNDRKLKGLRAPSVRRKITYKSPVKVSSIIEILDDEPEPEPVPEPEQVAELESDPEPASTSENFHPEETKTEPVKEEMSEKLAQTICLPTITLRKLAASDVAAYKNETTASIADEQQEVSPAKVAGSQTSPTKNDFALPISPPILASDHAPSSPLRFTRSLLNSPIKNTEAALSSPSKTSRTYSAVKSTSSPVKSDRNLRSSPCKNLSLSWSAADDVNVSSASPTKKKNTANFQCSPNKTNVVIIPLPNVDVDSSCASSTKRENATSERLLTLKDKMITSPLNVDKKSDETVENADTEKLPKNEIETEKTEENEVVIVEPSECTPDDELDFICTSNDETVFTDQNRRTYSRLMKATTSMVSPQIPMHISDIPTFKSSSPEIITVDANASIPATADDSKEDKTEESMGKTIDLSDEQQSISIFSSDFTKSTEDGDTINAENTSIVSEIVIMEEETLALSRDSRMELCLDKEPQVSAGTECLFYALLQRILAPYVGPSCLSKWSNESASREEVYKIIRSLDEGMEWMQSAGLMDSETKKFLNKLKYFKSDF